MLKNFVACFFANAVLTGGLLWLATNYPRPVALLEALALGVLTATKIGDWIAPPP